MELGDLLFRLGAAAFLGSLVGLDRQRVDKAAGLRTHMLVSVGSALIMIVSAYGFDGVIEPGRIVLDPSRVAAQVVSGIGFLGAGTIVVRKQLVHGLTTAASIWAVAAIGMAAGGALYLAATAATLIMLVILAVLKPVEDRLHGALPPRSPEPEPDRRRAYSNSRRSNPGSIRRASRSSQSGCATVPRSPRAGGRADLRAGPGHRRAESSSATSRRSPASAKSPPRDQFARMELEVPPVPFLVSGVAKGWYRLKPISSSTLRQVPGAVARGRKGPGTHDNSQ